tara:strand:+ start:80 stop:496 length:417 start_codon:yes stop_codon:yes gene_type:complete
MKYEVKNVKREVKREATTVTLIIPDFLSGFSPGMQDASQRLKKARRCRARRKNKKRGPLVDCYNNWKNITDVEVSKFKSNLGFDDTFVFSPLQAKNASKHERVLRKRVGGGRVWKLWKDNKLLALIRTSKAECFVERS